MTLPVTSLTVPAKHDAPPMPQQMGSDASQQQPRRLPAA